MIELSIIVPVYNVEKYLKRCINSILNQLYLNFELILVNDGSTDGSLSICREYSQHEERIVIIDKKNGGLSSARNAGLLAARGEYIAFVDSDDWISKYMYLDLMRYAKSANADIVSSSYRKVWNDAAHFVFRYPPRIFNRDAAKLLYLRNSVKSINDCPVWTKLYKKSIIEKYRFPEGVLYEDIVINYNIIDTALIYARTNAKYYNYYQSPGSITRGVFSEKQLDILHEIEKIIKVSVDRKTKKAGRIMKLNAILSIMYKIWKFKQVFINIDDYKFQIRSNIKDVLISNINVKKKLFALFAISPFCQFKVKA